MLQRFVLGTAQFGSVYGVGNKSGKLDQLEIKKILNLCLENNISILDTAHSYGSSEANLGNIGISKFDVMTKIPPLTKNVFRNGVVRDYLLKSLEKLNVNQVKGLLLHDACDLEQNEDIFHELLDLKKEGLTRNIGISVYDFHLMTKLMKKYELDFVQCPFNVFDRRLIKSKILLNSKNKKIKVYARSIFLQGLLLMPKKEIPNYFYAWHPLFEEWNDWINDNGLSAYEACLAFCLSHREIDYFLFGVDNITQMKQLIDHLPALTMLAEDLNFPRSLSSSDLKLINPSMWAIKQAK